MFVGRERELAQIGAALDGAAAGRGQLILLAGEPGIGKTSLADRAAALAGERGFRCCGGAAGRRAARPRTGRGWICSRSWRARSTTPRWRASLGDGAPLLVRAGAGVARAAAETPRRRGAPAEEGRFRLWRAVSALVHEAAKAKPRAARARRSARRAISRRCRCCTSWPASCARCGCCCSAATATSRRAWTPRTERSPVARRPRGDDAVAAAPGSRGGAAFVQERVGSVASDVEARVYDRSQGNPLFLEEMLRLWNEQGAEAITEGVVPHGVRDVIRQRLDRVAAETRALLDLAAVAGDVIDAPLLAAAAGRDAAWVSARLAEAGRAGVLAERGGHRRFGHALFREVLYRELAEDARRALHGRVGEALGRLAPAQLAEIAHHTLEGPPEMLGRAVEHAIRAAARRAGAARLRRGGRHAGPRAGRGDRCRQPAGAARARAAGAGRGAHPARRGGGRQGRLPRGRGAGALARRRRAGRAGGADLRQCVPVRRRRSGAGRDARGVDGAASARRQRVARAAARPAGGARCSPAPPAPSRSRSAREAIAIARRLGDDAALLDTRTPPSPR